jgi:RNA polymerase sigma factor (sigma-70 family)
MLSDKEITEGIAAHKSCVLNHVYSEYFPYVESFILQHGGTNDQAKDVFQDAMIIVYKKISSGKFSLHCKFGTYLYAVCKRIWIQDRKKHFSRLNKLSEISAVAESASKYNPDGMEEAKELFEKHFQKLGPECQKILRLYFNGSPIEEIRKIMGISTVHHTSDKKYRCKKALIERIKKDPLFRNYRNE